MARKRTKALKAARPSPAIQDGYRRRLDRLIEAMARSTAYWLTATYRQNEGEIEAAFDASASRELRDAVREMARRWEKRFDEAAPKLAAYFATASEKRSTSNLQRILRDGGYTVKFNMTPGMRNILNATTSANIALIKSIPQKYFLEVEGIVMRGVQSGYDLKSITDGLQSQFGITRRRAAFIARDQTNKANASMTRARQLEAGFTEAIWVHSGGGHEPRPTHVAAGRRQQRYDVAKGWYDPAVGKHIWPGTEINCRCVPKVVVPRND